MKSSAKKRTEISPAVDESHVPEGWTPSDMAHPFTMLSRVVVKSLLAAGTYAIGVCFRIIHIFYPAFDCVAYLLLSLTPRIYLNAG